MEQTLLKRSGLIFLIKVFPLAATLLAGILFSRSLPTSINGIYQKAWVVQAILLGVGCIGLPTFLLTHPLSKILRWTQRLKGRHVVFFSLWLLALGFVYALMLGLHQAIFRPWVMVSFLVVQALIIVGEGYMVIAGRHAALVTGSVIYAVGFIVAHLAVLHGDLALEQLFAVLLMIAAVRLVIVGVSAVQDYRRRRAGITGGNLPRAVRHQWAEVGLYDLSQILFRWLDKLIVGFAVAPALFAIYNNGTIDIPFIPLLVSAAGSGLMVQMHAGQVSNAERLGLINYSGKAFARIVFPIFFFLLVFRYELFEVVFTNKYRESVPLFAISVMVLPLRAYSFTAVLQHLGKIRIVNIGAVLDLTIALVLFYPLYLLFGLKGVAFAFLICTYMQVIYYLWHTAKALDCGFFDLIPWKAWLAMLILFGSIAIGVHYVAVRYMSTSYALLLGCCVTAVTIAVACFPLIRRRTTYV